MKWGNLRSSEHLEDRRGKVPVKRGIGLGGVLFALAISWFFGINPMTVLSVLDSGQSVVSERPVANSSKPQSQEVKFVRAILGDLEDTWTQLLPQAYRPAKLVLFQSSVKSACGRASSATGPFYCPADYKIYLDLSFFRELSQRYQASGDFAQAYVIAHEKGHHIQQLLGTSTKVHQAQRSLGKAQSNALSVRLELQADCYAGLWAHYAEKRNLLDSGDLIEALKAATEIGDDRLQMRSQGYVVPESFTHGSAVQRTKWFKRGFKSGHLSACNTFGS